MEKGVKLSNLERAVKKCLGTSVFSSTGIGGGGCISSGSSYVTDNGVVFVKVNNKRDARTMFEGEEAGLNAILRTKTVKCPKPMCIVVDKDEAALVMENLDLNSISSSQQKVLGEQIARMHLYNKIVLDKADKEGSRITSAGGGGGVEEDVEIDCPVSKFGFNVPTCCGYIAQDNSWEDDWTVFYVRQKLQAQVDLILNKEGDRELKDIWPLCRQKIEDHLSKLNNVIPALLHGDLWNGNVGSASSQPVVYDPASFFGHSEYDFGISYMFSGFTSGFYESYFKIIPQTEGFLERKDMYELFHHLNHWNHFGSGYRGSTIRLMKKISNSKYSKTIYT